MRTTPLTLPLVLAACGGPTPTRVTPPEAPSAAPAVTGPFEADTALRWLADGRLLVDRGYELHPNDPTLRPTNVELPIGAEPVFGPEGAVLTVEGATLTAGGVEVAIPSWIEGAPASDLLHAAYWLDAHRVYVHQVQPHQGSTACRLYDLKAAAWHLPTAECVRGDFHAVSGLERGPGPILGVRSGGEGVQGLRLTQYDPRRGQTDTQAPELVGDDTIRVAFEPGGGTAWVITTCSPKSGGTCRGHTGPPALYGIDLMDGTVTALGPVPANAVPAPDGRLAWIAHGAVCVGRPDHATCYAP